MRSGSGHSETGLSACPVHLALPGVPRGPGRSHQSPLHPPPLSNGGSGERGRRAGNEGYVWLAARAVAGTQGGCGALHATRLRHHGSFHLLAPAGERISARHESCDGVGLCALVSGVEGRGVLVLWARFLGVRTSGSSPEEENEKRRRQAAVRWDN